MHSQCPVLLLLESKKGVVTALFYFKDIVNNPPVSSSNCRLGNSKAAILDPRHAQVSGQNTSEFVFDTC